MNASKNTFMNNDVTVMTLLSKAKTNQAKLGSWVRKHRFINYQCAPDVQ